MTEQQREAFEAWYNDEYVRPIIPADRTEGGYQNPDAQAAWDAWQAALSHAERRELQTEQDLINFLDGLHETAGPDSSALTGQKWVAAQRAIEGIRSHAEGEAPFAYCFTDVNGRPTEFTDGPEHSAPEDKRVITALYTHPAPQVVFSDTQEEIEARLVDQLENSCPHCGGSGHKDDVAAPQVAVPEGWRVRSGVTDVEGDGGVGFMIGAPPMNGVRDNTSVWLDDEDPAHRLLAIMLAAAPTAPAGGPDENDDLVIQADAYRYACEDLERWQSERAKAGKEIGTEGSLVDGMAWLYGYIDRLERLLTDPRPGGVCPHGVRGVHECEQCADDAPAHITRASVERDIAALKAREQPVSDPDGLPGTPRPMSTAPRDGTMVRLLVQFTNHGVNDGFDSGPAWTIGANTYDDSCDDEWHIAGWDWQQDCFAAGEGEPLGWLPMLSAPAPDEREPRLIGYTSQGELENQNERPGPAVTWIAIGNHTIPVYVGGAPDEREIAARAIERAVGDYFKAEDGPHNLHDYLLWRVNRLRAGKEGEPS